MIDPNNFKACGAGITAIARATFLSETTTTTTTDQEASVSHSDPTSSAALRSVKSRRAGAGVPGVKSSWRDHLDPYEEPRGDVERDEAAAMGLDAWRRQQAYMRWSHSRGDFGID